MSLDEKPRFIAIDGNNIVKMYPTKYRLERDVGNKIIPYVFDLRDNLVRYKIIQKIDKDKHKKLVK